MPLAARLFAITIDGPDPHALAAFYRSFLGGELRSANDDFVVLIAADGATRLDFQRVANPEAGTWPDATAARRVHLDFAVDDLGAATQHICALGARLAEAQPGGDRFRVLIDPAGHPFCISPPTAATTLPPRLPDAG